MATPTYPVKWNTIYIYEHEETAAIETLKHELVDYAISKAIEPYKEVENRLLSLVNEQAYDQKEKLVERLARLL